MRQRLNIIKEFSSVLISRHRIDSKKSGGTFREDSLRLNPKKAIHIENAKEYTKVAGVKQ